MFICWRGAITLALIVVNFTLGTVVAEEADHAGFRDGVKMMAEPGPQSDLSEAAVSFSAEAADAAVDLGVPFDRIVREIREGHRVRWSDPNFESGNHFQIFLTIRKAKTRRFAIHFDVLEGGVEVTDFRRFATGRDRWAWAWTHYHSFDRPPEQTLLISDVAYGRAGGGGPRQFTRTEIERAFDHPIGAPLTHHEYPALKWHVGAVSPTELVSLIYRVGNSRADARIYRADPSSSFLTERFLALNQDLLEAPADPTDVEFIPGLRQKLAWKHKLTWAEFLEALKRPREYAPNPRLEAIRDGLTRYYYVTDLASGKPVAVYLAPTTGRTKIFTAHQASARDCANYLTAVGPPMSPSITQF